MIGIYKITSPTKKVYIGQSVNIEKRLLHYKGLHCKTQTVIYNSLLKYGFEKHKFEVICECEIHELNDKERYYQDLYSAIGISGMNCKLTTAKQRSGKLSQETKFKMSVKRTGMKQSKETCLKKSERMKGEKNHNFGNTGEKNPFFGKTHTEETKLKISLRNKGQIAPNKNKKHSFETKKKISIKSIGNKYCLGRVLSEETKNKISNSLCKKVINTETLEVYNSYKELALLLKTSHNTLNKKLNGNKKNDTNYKYL